MPTVKLLTTGGHAPWKPGEIVAVAYECETLETFPADIKDQHAAELALRDTNHAAVVDDLQAKHAAELAQFVPLTVATPTTSEQTVGVGEDVAFNAQHQKDLADHLAKQAATPPKV
jgi:hypothetical protein